MAKISADSHWICRKVCTFAQMFEIGTDSRCGKKRKVGLERDEDENSIEGKKNSIEIDRFKKLQCSMILKRLMVHPDGFVFKKPVDPKKPIDLEMVKFKLDRALYLGTAEFADDVRLLFSNAISCYPPNHEIHKMAKRLRQVFEVKWRSLNKRWKTEKAKGDQSLATKESEPLKKLNHGSADKNACPHSLHQAVSMESASKKEVKKPKGDQCPITEKAKGDQSLITKGSEPLRKLKQGSADENACPNTLHQAASMEVASKKKLKKPKQRHFLDTILAAQGRLVDFSGTSEMPKKRQREAARVALQQMERTVCIDDNLKYFEELELLCGHSLSYCSSVHPLKNLGLLLKDEFIADWDEERLFNGDWDPLEKLGLLLKDDFIEDWEEEMLFNGDWDPLEDLGSLLKDDFIADSDEELLFNGDWDWDWEEGEMRI